MTAITAILRDGTKIEIIAPKLVGPVLKLFRKNVIAGYIIKPETWSLYNTERKN